MTPFCNLILCEQASPPHDVCRVSAEWANRCHGVCVAMVSAGPCMTWRWACSSRPGENTPERNDICLQQTTKHETPLFKRTPRRRTHNTTRTNVCAKSRTLAFHTPRVWLGFLLRRYLHGLNDAQGQPAPILHRGACARAHAIVCAHAGRLPASPPARSTRVMYHVLVFVRISDLKAMNILVSRDWVYKARRAARQSLPRRHAILPCHHAVRKNDSQNLIITKKVTLSRTRSNHIRRDDVVCTRASGIRGQGQQGQGQGGGSCLVRACSRG